jgi:hypothetical protein
MTYKTIILDGLPRGERDALPVCTSRHHLVFQDDSDSQLLQSIQSSCLELQAEPVHDRRPGVDQSNRLVGILARSVRRQLNSGRTAPSNDI